MLVRAFWFLDNSRNEFQRIVFYLIIRILQIFSPLLIIGSMAQSGQTNDKQYIKCLIWVLWVLSVSSMWGAMWGDQSMMKIMDGGDVIRPDYWWPCIIITWHFNIFKKIHVSPAVALFVVCLIFLSPISGRVTDTISTKLLCHKVKAAQFVGWSSALQLTVWRLSCQGSLTGMTNTRAVIRHYIGLRNVWRKDFILAARKTVRVKTLVA